MSDRGIPATYRHMNGYGSHTFSFINSDNERFWCKFHFKTQQGIKNLTNEEAETIIGKDRESHQRDLLESIDNGDFPKWTMYVQIMPELEADEVDFNPFDLTKVWSQKDYPLLEVGEFELNRNPENYFAEENCRHSTQQLSFLVSVSLLINASGPPICLRRYAALPLGVNHHQITVNAPRCPVHSYHRDGAMRVDGNFSSTIGYEPNYQRVGRTARLLEPPLRIKGQADNHDHREDEDYSHKVAIYSA